MQFWLHYYTVVSYQALFRLSVYKFPAVCLSGAKNVFLHDKRLCFPDYKLCKSVPYYLWYLTTAYHNSRNVKARELSTCTDGQTMVNL